MSREPFAGQAPTEGRPSPDLSVEEAAQRYRDILEDQERERNGAEGRNWELGELVARTTGIEDNPKATYRRVVERTKLTSVEAVRLNHRTFKVFPAAVDRVSWRPWKHHQAACAPVRRLLRAEGIKKPKPTQIGSRAREFLDEKRLNTAEGLREAIAAAIRDKGGTSPPKKRRLAAVLRQIETLGGEIEAGTVEQPEKALDAMEQILRRLRPRRLRGVAKITQVIQDELPPLTDTARAAELSALMDALLTSQMGAADGPVGREAVHMVRREFDAALIRAGFPIAHSTETPPSQISIGTTSSATGDTE